MSGQLRIANGVEMPGNPAMCLPAKPSSAKLTAQAGAPGLCIAQLSSVQCAGGSKAKQIVWVSGRHERNYTASLSACGSAQINALPSGEPGSHIQGLQYSFADRPITETCLETSAPHLGSRCWTRVGPLALSESSMLWKYAVSSFLDVKLCR